MDAEFEELIRQSMRGSPRIADPSQGARDTAARRMNMKYNGIDSTAWPRPGAGANTPAPAQVAPAQSGQSDLQAAIAAQVGEDGPPIPTQRPADAGMDDMRAEAIAENKAGMAPVEQMIVQQMGDASAMEQAGVKFPSPAQPLPHPGQGAPPQAATDNSGGMDMSRIGEGVVALLIALGGPAGVASLIQRYRMGNPDAARTFQAIGMSPDDLSMLAGEPSNAVTRSVAPQARMQSDNAGLQTMAPRQINDPAVTGALKQAYPVGAAQVAPAAALQQFIDADQSMRNVQMDENAKQGAEGVEANTKGGGNAPEYKTRAKSAKNLPSSRPKAKVKVKAK